MLPSCFPVLSLLAGWAVHALRTPGQTSVVSQVYVDVCPRQWGKEGRVGNGEAKEKSEISHHALELLLYSEKAKD